MSIINKAMYVILLSVLSAGASAATEVTDTTGYTVIGHVSSSEKTTIDDITQELSAKADKAGAPYFKVTSITGNNQLHGNAILLK